ncbi:MAG: non-ribosomal peptide synthetase, partial [bacterium]|nr:non-ribosomal peptide synthetase [bacterium]
QEDLIVGSPIAGRGRLETEGLVGFFLNTLALRTEVAGDLSFRDLLGRVRRVVLAATAHQEVPFEKLLEELQPERNLSHSPVFQVFFNMLNLPDQHFAVPGLLAEPLAVPAVESKFDLTLYVSEIEGTIELNLVYGRDLFDGVRMVEMLAQYAALLARMAEHPEAAIGSCSLVTVEAEKLLPGPAAPLSDRWEGSLHEGFSRQAERHPDHPAACEPDEECRHGALGRRGNQLARYLVAGGVEPG